MAKTRKTTISINENDFSVKDVILKGADAPLEHRICSMIKLKSVMDKISNELAQLKVVYEEISNSVTTVSYEENIKSLVKRGVIWNSDYKPVFEFSTNDGGVYSVNISQGIDECFAIDPHLSQKAVIDSLDERYKKVSISLDKAVIKSEFESGALPASLSMFCSKNPVEITKLRTSVKVQPTVKDEDEN